MGFLDGRYICNNCGYEMELIEDEMTLYCPHCGRDVSVEDYGTEYEDDYDSIPILFQPDDDEEDYPTFP